MRILRNAACLAVLLGFTTFATADAQVGQAGAIPDDITASIGGAAQGSEQVLALTDEQRSRIYDYVMHMPDARVAHVPVPDRNTILPASVPLQELPRGVVREIPWVEGHKFVKLDDRILVVDAHRHIVAEIPRYKLVLQ